MIKKLRTEGERNLSQEDFQTIDRDQPVNGRTRDSMGISKINLLPKSLILFIDPKIETKLIFCTDSNKN